MRHRKQFVRKPKDILGLTLRNMVVGDEVFFTPKTYEAIKYRVNEFTKAREDRRWSVIPWGGIRKIKRTA